jgi:hypothetical protein
VMDDLLLVVMFIYAIGAVINDALSIPQSE